MLLSRRSLLRGAGAAGAVLLAGCGSSGPGDPAGPAAGGVSVTDQRGRLLTLDEPAKRVVTIVIPAASMLVALDARPDRLVGVNASAAEAIRGGILGEIYPAAARIPGNVSDQSFVPNVEAILALNPDLVIQWADRGSEVIAPLENAGLTVAGLTYGTQADLEAWIGLFGTLIGRPDRADALLGRMRRRLDSVRAAPPAGPPPKIVYFNQMRGGLKAAGKGTYNDFCIELVGGRNPARELPGHAAVDVEQVLAWDPDIVLVGNFDPATPAEDVYSVPAWRGMSAVRNRRAYKVPLGGYRWDPPNQESPLMWRWMRAMAFPDPSGAAGTQLRAEMLDDYRFLYGHELAQRQIDAILRTEMNAASANHRWPGG